jgi:hypothetical protein
VTIFVSPPPYAPKCPVCFLPMSLYVKHYTIRGNYECPNIHCTYRGEVKA